MDNLSDAIRVAQNASDYVAAAKFIFYVVVPAGTMLIWCIFTIARAMNWIFYNPRACAAIFLGFIIVCSFVAGLILYTEPYLV